MRLVKPKTFPGWILLIFGVCWNLLGVWARIEFVFKKAWPEKSMMPVLTVIASSSWFPIILSFFGLVWIYWFTRPISQQQAEEIKGVINQTTLKAVDEPIIKQAPLIVRSEVIKVKYPQSQVIGGITWTNDLIDLRVAIENPTDSDYQDIDITIRADFPNTYIRAVGQISNLPGVTFVNPGIQLLGLDKSGNPIIKFASTTGHTIGDGCKIITHGTKSTLLPNYYRVRCEKLFNRTTIEITLAIAKEFILEPNSKINNVWLKGQYYGGSTIQTIDQNIAVSN